MGGVQGFRPLFVPVEEIGVVVEALRKIFLGEFFNEGEVGEIGLGFEFLRRMEIFLFFPVDGDLCFGRFFRARCFGAGRARVCFSSWAREDSPGGDFSSGACERESAKVKSAGSQRRG